MLLAAGTLEPRNKRIACPYSRCFSIYDREAAAYVQASAKGRRGRLVTASKLPVTRGNSGDLLFWH